MPHDDDLELLEGELLDEDDLGDVDEFDELEDHGVVHGVRGFAAGLVVGLLVGAGSALLIAPEAGTKVRRRLRRGFKDLQDDAQSQLSDLRGDAIREFRRKKRQLKRRLRH